MKSNLRRSIIGCFAVGLLLSGVSVAAIQGAERSDQWKQDTGRSVDGSDIVGERVSRARTPEWFRMRSRVKAC